MGDTVLHPSQRHGSDEEDDEDKVGEQSRNLDNICVIWKVLVKENCNLRDLEQI